MGYPPVPPPIHREPAATPAPSALLHGLIKNVRIESDPIEIATMGGVREFIRGEPRCELVLDVRGDAAELVRLYQDTGKLLAIGGNCVAKVIPKPPSPPPNETTTRGVNPHRLLTPTAAALDVGWTAGEWTYPSLPSLQFSVDWWSWLGLLIVLAVAWMGCS